MPLDSALRSLSRTRTGSTVFLVAALAGVLSCGGGQTPQEPPPPPPPPPPVAPVPVGSIPAQTLNVGETVRLDVSPYFRDPDGGALTYAAASLAPGVVSVSQLGSVLTMVGVAQGTAAVTVTATDPDRLSAAQSVAVTVLAPNRAPEAVGSIPAQSVDAGGRVTLDVSGYFRDPDGDALTYTAATSAAGVVSVSLSGSSLTMVGVAAGNATVTVTAADPGGLTAAQSAAVTVRASNRAPEAVGSIPAQSLDAGGRVTVDMSGYFRDPDGDALTYTAVTSDAGVASASTSGGSRLTVVGIGPGSANVQVTASDPAGLTATQNVGVTVRGRSGGGFGDGFDDAASLDNWEAHNADAEVIGGVLHLTNRVSGSLGLLERSSPPRLSQWSVSARIGRATRQASPGVASLTRHRRFSAVRLVLRTLDNGGDAGSSADVAGTMAVVEDRNVAAAQSAPGGATGTNYELAVLDADRGWIQITNLSGHSDAVDERPNAFTDIEMGLDNGNFVAHAQRSETGESETLFQVSLNATLDDVRLGDILSELNGLWLVNQGPVGATSHIDDVVATGEATSNRAPEAVGSLPAQTLNVGQTRTLDVSGYFRDPDGDVLVYVTSSSNPGLVSATMSRSRVTVTGVAVGSATVTVTASDPGGLSAAQNMAVTVQTAASDRAALEAFYEAAGGPNWTNNDGWLTNAPLDEWYGVWTDSQGRVVTLALPPNNLTGEISPELGNLANLEVLSLFGLGDSDNAGNDLTGEIPPELGNLTALRSLDVRYNRLSGEIPPEFGNLTALLDLRAAGNQLTGEIPPEFGGLTNLQTLNVQANRLTGEIPPDLGGLANLRALIVTHNELSGEIPPELGGLANLQRLWLGGNSLTGEIPPELADLGSLEDLYLWENELTGEIPPELGGLANLQRLALYDNELMGEIPDEIGALTSLEHLVIHRNELRGRLPESFLNLALESFWWYENEGLCAPDTSAFRTWLAGIGDNRAGAFCGDGSDDRSILKILYNATDGPNWTTNTNWLTDAPLEDWHGVGVDDSGRVVSLSLSRNNLNGPLVPEIGDLAKLRLLDLSYNEVTGSLPPEIGKLSELERLTLWSTSLTGTLPRELANLDNLVYLLIAWADLIPGPIPDWIADMASLEHLALRNVNLTGPIPDWLSAMDHLKTLRLADNDLTGPIPDWLSSFTDLAYLTLDDNDLTGPIPDWLGEMTNLHRLGLGGNDLTRGPIPAWFGDLVNLRSLYLDNLNREGSIPPELGELVSLRELFFDNNPELAGPLPLSLARLTDMVQFRYHATGICVPDDEALRAWLNAISVHQGTGVDCGSSDDRSILEIFYNATDGPNWRDNTNWLTDAPLGEWYGVSTDASGRVVELDLSGRFDSDLREWIRHGLNGEIPPELGNLANLRTLYLYGNNLSGSIPSELGNLANLSYLFLGYNDLAGSIPPELGNLAELTWLRLPTNDLAGSIPPELGNLAELTWLELDHNNLSGSIPPELGNLASLETLNLVENNLSGSIPPKLGSLANLAVLALDQNDLSGLIPSELGNLANLGTASLTSNNLSGSIPRELGNLAELTWLSLDQNDLSGSIPSELGNLEELELLALTGNDLSGSLPPELGDLGDLRRLYVNDNELAGSLPDSFLNLLLDGFWWYGNAALCAPDTSAFRTWLAEIGDNRPGPFCGGNRPPEAVGTIPPQTLEPDGETSLNVSSYFRDPDGDALTYTASSSNTDVVVATMWANDNRVLVLNAGAPGTATVTVTAADPAGLTATQAVSVTVRATNRAPEAVGTIGHQTLKSGQTRTLDVSGHFRDPDGDALTYSTASNNPGVVSVSMSGSSLTMVAAAAGHTSVSVTATDPAGLSVTQNVGVTVVADLVRLTSNSAIDYAPAWSPDGDQIAFTTDRDGNNEIYVMNASGSGVTRLTDHSRHDIRPSWSPDGDKIAFESERHGNREVYVMNADGSEVTRLTDHSAFDYDAAWSPDGTKIAFVSDRDGNREIYVMNADGSGVTRLTNNTVLDDGPAWSPDGDKIAFSSGREIHVMNADGSGVTRLTSRSRDGNPAWSPDGGGIAFNSQRDGDYEIYMMNADGSGVTRLTNNTGLDLGPAWSPDGTRIAFESDRFDNREIFVMNVPATDSSASPRADLPGDAPAQRAFEVTPPASLTRRGK